MRRRPNLIEGAGVTNTGCGFPQIATPQQRARLADAIVRLRDQHRVTRTQAACAIYHLNTRSQHLLAASLTHTIAVTAGASRTPGGLQIAA
ncbi:MAG: hypothetical protein WBP81_31115 [Solirubrobacteraceae bacterium]